MRPRFPLGLKIFLWFLLNVVVLTAVVASVLFAQVGFGWGALLHGQAGSRIHAMGEVVMTEVTPAKPSDRDGVLLRLGKAYRMQLTLWQNGGRRIAGSAVQLPQSVRSLLHGARMPSEGPPPKERRDGSGPLRADEAEGLFLVRAGSPAAYWIGIRTPWSVDPEEDPVPATLIASAPSLATLAALFDWRPWLWDMAGALVISGLFWWPFVHGLTRRLATLGSAADRIAEGRLDTRVPVRQGDEIGLLGQSVNRMAERLENLVSGQKRFLADAAHELSSPLARLQLAVGILEEKAPEDLRSALVDVREEAQAMSELTGGLLAYARAELAPPTARLEAVKLASLVRRVLDREGLALGVKSSIPAGLQAWADPELLQRALGNLVRNAVRYSRGSEVEVAARPAGNDVILEVLDRGPGVAESELSRLGEPFFRPVSSRTREAGGTGLGLAIVRNCALACGGSVKFRNRIGGGFGAELRLSAEIVEPARIQVTGTAARDSLAG